MLGVSSALTKLSRVIGGGPPSLFWPTNGVISVVLSTSPTVQDFAMVTASCIVGIALAQFGDVSKNLAFLLATANAAEFTLYGAVMYYVTHHKREFKDLVRTYSFYFFQMLASLVLSTIGASLGALFLHETTDVDYSEAWFDWWIGDTTGGFVSVGVGYIVWAHILEHSGHSEHSDTYLSRGDVPSVAAMVLVLAILSVLYFLVESPTGSLALIMVTTPILGTMLIFCPKFIGIVGTSVAIMMIVTVTNNQRGPIYNLIQETEDSDLTQKVFFMVELCLIFMSIMMFTISITREKLIEKSEKLEAKKKEQEGFFAYVSHEFRTPLNVILSYSEDLARDPSLSKTSREDMMSIVDAALHMTLLVDDILTVFKQRSELVSVSRIVETDKFVSDIRSFSSRLCRSKDQSLQISQHQVPPSMKFDPHRVRQVVLNLVSNSVKFTESGGAVHIDFHLDGKDLVFSVEDNGVGIGSDHIPRLFDNFFRCPESSNEIGSGLGLGICKEIMKSMKGDIQVQSVLGEGTKFTCRVPDVSLEEEKEEEKDIEKGTNTKCDGRNVRRNVRRNVLVVEDSAATQKIMCRILEGNNFSTVCAFDGQEALDLLRDQRFDIMLLDLGIPVKSGLQVLEETRSSRDARLRDLPVLVLTGESMESVQKKCQDYTNVRFACKPFRQQDVLKIIHEMVMG